MAGELVRNQSELMKVISDAWKTAPAALGIAGPFSDIVFRSRDSDGVPDIATGGKPWARCVAQNDGGKSTCISGRRYKVTGRLTVQIFVRGDKSNAKSVSQNIADHLVNALRDHDGEVSLLNIAALDRLGDGGFERTDTVAEFYWHSFRERPQT